MTHSRVAWPDGYVGRFAPSPTGPLHAGSLVAAMASYLDARVHDGRWLLRIEDLDPPREVAGATRDIIDTLAALGLHPDGPILLQSERGQLYADALARLRAAGLVYPCCCSRREIADSVLRLGAAERAIERGENAEAVYPGTCRGGMRAGASPRAWRVRVDDAPIVWRDRALGAFSERLDLQCGDFVLKRADGFWAYQLAVVVDDALCGINSVVRGDDLLGSTARQIYLQRLLDLPTPTYLHIPVVRNPQGEKLSKQTLATALDLSRPLDELGRAARFLQLGAIQADSIDGFWIQAARRWQQRLTGSGAVGGGQNAGRTPS